MTAAEERTQSAAEIAGRLGLHCAWNRREWRGTCPTCGYGADAFVLTERNGRLLWWCAACQDGAAIAGTLFGGGPRPAVLRTAIADRDREERRPEKRERALAALARVRAGAGTPADRYLTARGLAGVAASPALRFRADMPHPGGGRLPALVALVVDAAGRPVGIHRTYLKRDGRGKADVNPARATLGAIWSGAVRLDPGAPELVVGEGIEFSASAGRLVGCPAWAAMSAGNLARGLISAEVRTAVIAADRDEAGERAARDAALRWSREGRRLRIARPDAGGADFNDVLLLSLGGAR